MRRNISIGLTVLAGLFLVLFGTQVLNNIHNLYLRALSGWTVMLTNSEGTSGATGFVVKGRSGNKFILTNNHVCGLAQNGLLTANYRGEKFQVQVFKRYEFNDLCALTAHRPLGLAVNVARQVALGENTWVIGHPLLEPLSVNLGELSGTVFITLVMKVNPEKGECVGPTYTEQDLSGTIFAELGITSVCYRTLEAQASTMSIQPGNSGSAVVNLFGSVVGVAFAANESGTRSYIVPLSDLREFLNEL